MRKLRLDIEAVQVESFLTQAGAASRGTVDARQGRETFTCPSPTVDSCVGTCTCGTGGTGGTATADVTCWSCDPTCDTCEPTCLAATCDTCQITCNQATGPERCCA